MPTFKIVNSLIKKVVFDKQKMEDNLKAKFLELPIPAGIIEEWEKVK